MVRLAHDNLKAEFADRVRFVAGDLVALPFRACFDGIFSTASFHWVLDHDALFRNVFASLKKGGWLHAQCGGGPNLARLRERVRSLSRAPEFAHWLADFPEPWFFSDAEGAASRLRTAGFEGIETGLEPASFAASNSREFQDYLRTFVLHRHLELLPQPALRDSFARQVADASARDDPPWTLDYWRLNLRARKAA
jgi:SAM-dependent methyltransferase